MHNLLVGSHWTTWKDLFLLLQFAFIFLTQPLLVWNFVWTVFHGNPFSRILLFIYMHINIISAAISKWLIIGMWIGEWLILPETVNHRHSWGLSCSWYVHPIKSIFSMKNAPKNDLWAPDPARHGTARREGAMLVARLESWRKANVNRPIHGEAGKKRKNLPPVTLKKWWVVLEYSGTKKIRRIFDGSVVNCPLRVLVFTCV